MSENFPDEVKDQGLQPRSNHEVNPPLHLPNGDEIVPLPRFKTKEDEEKVDRFHPRKEFIEIDDEPSKDSK